MEYISMYIYQMIPRENPQKIDFERFYEEVTRGKLMET
jgi:hypothetical protein